MYLLNFIEIPIIKYKDSMIKKEEPWLFGLIVTQSVRAIKQLRLCLRGIDV